MSEDQNEGLVSHANEVPERKMVVLQRALEMDRVAAGGYLEINGMTLKELDSFVEMTSRNSSTNGNGTAEAPTLSVQEEFNERLRTCISDLELGTRSDNSLEGKGIFQVKDLARMSDEALLAITNVGEKVVSDINAALHKVLSIRRLPTGELVDWDSPKDKYPDPPPEEVSEKPEKPVPTTKKKPAKKKPVSATKS